MENYIVRKTVAIHAPAEAVWDALTNPDKTKAYFFNCKVFSTWQPGDDITFKGTILLVKKIEMNGKILEIEPGKRLKYRLENTSDGSETSSTVTDELFYANGVTTVNVTDDVGSGEGAQERFERSEKGWEKVLSGLKEFVEKA